MAKRKLISLFSGAGGLDYGFEAAGFETGVAVEFDLNCCETLGHNRRWPVIHKSIFDVSTQEMLDAAGLKKGEPALLIGGPPCQPFSKSGYWKAGDSKRLADPRAETLAAYLRVLEESQPEAFLLENVGGLAFSDKDEGLQFLLDQIQKINRRRGTSYRPTFQLLNAADYGVPQLRQRFFLIGARDGSSFTFPVATHAPPGDVESSLPGAKLSPYRTAWDAIGDLPPEGDGTDLSMRGKWAGLLPSIPEGENYLFHTDRGDGLPLFGWRRRYWNFLLKLAKNRPSWTVQAQPGPSVGPFHWKNRRLSIRELCRIQTFPDSIEITGDRTTAQRQIGNAVPALMAEVLGRAIASQMFAPLPHSKTPTLLPPVRDRRPQPERRGTVPRSFLALSGDHTAHPGTGLGYSASTRRTESMGLEE
jgi:DNA (cytosine-5)-methyltransferase 1